MTISQDTTIQAYQLRKGGAPARMAILRMIANERSNAKIYHTPLNPNDWKKARSWTLKSYQAAYCSELNRGKNDNAPIWYCHTGEYFRNERDTHQVVNTRHTGYYTDTDQFSLAIGIVASLPHGKFIAGYRWTSNDERIYFADVFDDEEEAAHMADEHSRVFAESAREDSEKYDVARNLENEIESDLLALRNNVLNS